MSGAVKPVSTAEAAIAFRPLSDHQRVLLAVSGGRDSLALLHLAARWRSETPDAPDIVAATVDHGLRAAAAGEAGDVAAMCAALDVLHVTTNVESTGATPAPASGIQAWAREARYAALCRVARKHGCTAIVTGHQADDQAETLLMRLARGSGPDGLSAMAPQTRREEFALLRPLLGLERNRLTATLEDAGITWSDDPSNTDPAFERTRYAEHGNALHALGLSPVALGTSARRLRLATQALEFTAQAWLQQQPDLASAVELGAARLPLAAFGDQPAGLRHRVLQLLVHWVGGTAPNPRLAQIEALDEMIATANPAKTTLGGCRIVARDGHLTVIREPGRNGLPELVLSPGETAVWDARFDLTLPGAAGPVRIAPANPANCANMLRAAMPGAWAPPAQTLPAIWPYNPNEGGENPIVPPGSRQVRSTWPAFLASRHGLAG